MKHLEVRTLTIAIAIAVQDNIKPDSCTNYWRVWQNKRRKDSFFLSSKERLMTTEHTISKTHKMNEWQKQNDNLILVHTQSDEDKNMYKIIHSRVIYT